jgi:glycosyltransferase involved in cell wall biosynthesis
MVNNFKADNENRCRWSVIIPAYNADGRIAPLLEALEHQDIPREDYEIIVVDDGSNDDTAEVVKSFSNVRLLQQHNRGPATARNLGAYNANGEIVLFTDSDCIPTSNWISQMVTPLLNPQVVGVKGVYRTQQKLLIARFIQAEYQDKYRKMSKKKSIDFIDTYSAAYRKELFFKYHGFDENFPVPSAEDVEFSFRLSEAGHLMVFNPQAVVNHIFEDTLWGYIRKKFKNGFWRLMAVRHHPTKILHDSHTPQIQKLQICLALLGILSIIGGIVSSTLWWGLLGTFLLHQISTIPFQIRLSKFDVGVLPLSFLLLPIRSVSLSLGLISGAVALGIEWRKHSA